MFTPLITHDSDGTALAAPVDAARRNGATYKTRTIDDLRIKDDRLRAAIDGTLMPRMIQTLGRQLFLRQLS